MRILVYRESRPELALGPNERAGHTLALLRLGVGLLNCSNNERTDGCARTFGTLAQALMQRFGDVDSGPDSHDIIMSQLHPGCVRLFGSLTQPWRLRPGS